MRHRRRGRKLGRNPKHQRALLRSLATALILTTRDADGEPNEPKNKGRIITTLQKAKEVRPLVERCVTIARRALPHQEAADRLEPEAERQSDAWRSWRNSEKWNQWNQTIAPVVAARRRVLKLLGDKQATKLLFDGIAPDFADRPGGYTRIMRLAKPRLGDAGTRAILEFVGEHDRIRSKTEKPAFESESVETKSVETKSDKIEAENVADDEQVAEQKAQDETDQPAEDAAEEEQDEKK
jgi:large subunit ribosomal protein L17